MIVGQGSDFLYRDGTLCYLREGTVCVLKLHDAAKIELVLDIGSLLRQDASSFLINLLHYQDDVLSVFITPQSNDGLDGRLVVFDTKTDTPESSRLLRNRALPSGYRQFVRHDSTHLVYGTYSGNAASDDDIWRFWLLDLTTRTKPPKTISPGGLTSAEIGSSVVFEVIDGFFFGLTSQITIDAEGRDPLSFYGGFRYSLEDNAPKSMVWRAWRRQQREGPIHDLWTDLGLEKDETTGKLLIRETRREWQDGFSKQSRTFYTQPLIFPPNGDPHHLPLFDSTPYHAQIATSPCKEPSSDGDGTIESMLSDPTAELIPAFAEPIQRQPEHVHPEYNSSQRPPTTREFSIANTKHRTYNTGASAFLDVVLDQQSRIRFRIGSRKYASPMTIDPMTGIMTLAKQKSFVDRGVNLWPSERVPQELVDLLNPTHGPPRNLKVVSDERSTVYMASGKEDLPSIILVNFDPAIKFEGLQNWNEMRFDHDELGHMSPGKSVDKDHESWARIQDAWWTSHRQGYQFY